MERGDNNQLGLGDLRRKANITQRKLADILDVTIKTVSAWERGEHEPRLTLLQTTQLMDALQCSLEDLIEVMAHDVDATPDEPRLTFAQTKRLTEVLDCSIEDLTEAMTRWPTST